MSRRLVRKLQNGTLGTETDEPEDEDMAVNVGNTIHYHTGSSSGGNTDGAGAAGTDSPPSLLSKVAGPLVAAALAAGGAGGLTYWLTGDQPETPALTDTDTQYELHIGGE